MHKFYTQVDKRSRLAMTGFLKGHFRYHTMNCWNCSTSYACNIKIHQLGIETEILMKLYEMIQVDEIYDGMRYLISEFDATHNYKWQAGTNGRSGGYLVLYQGFTEPIECKTDERQNFTERRTRTSVYPGKSVDMDEDFIDWDIDELRDRVTLVQAFDQLADDIVAEAIYIASHCNVQVETIMAPQTRMVLV